MGRDGAKGLLRLRERGAVTIAQDEETSVVFGMPGEAVRIGAAQHVLPPDRIAELVRSLAKSARHEQ
jgi:two-component system chemotaxis response regulator CheB